MDCSNTFAYKSFSVSSFTLTHASSFYFQHKSITQKIIKTIGFKTNITQ